MVFNILNNVGDKILDFVEKNRQDDFLCDDYKEFTAYYNIF